MPSECSVLHLCSMMFPHCNFIYFLTLDGTHAAGLSMLPTNGISLFYIRYILFLPFFNQWSHGLIYTDYFCSNFVFYFVRFSILMLCASALCLLPLLLDRIMLTDPFILECMMSPPLLTWGLCYALHCLWRLWRVRSRAMVQRIRGYDDPLCRLGRPAPLLK